MGPPHPARRGRGCAPARGRAAATRSADSAACFVFMNVFASLRCLHAYRTGCFFETEEAGQVRAARRCVLCPSGAENKPGADLQAERWCGWETRSTRSLAVVMLTDGARAFASKQTINTSLLSPSPATVFHLHARASPRQMLSTSRS